MNLRRLFKKPAPEFAFCEPVWASSVSRWHIRPVTKVGLKTGGGADTKALCGVVVSWDLEVKINEHDLAHGCPKCAEAYKNLNPRLPFPESPQ